MMSRRETEVNNQRDNFDYRRHYLSQLPRIVKNRSLDSYRQSLRTASEEYGHFWTNDAPSNNTPLPPISASNNHHPQQPGTGSSTPDDFQMTSDRNRVIVYNDNSVLSKPLFEAPHSGKWRRYDQKQTVDDRDDDDVGSFRIRRDYDESKGRRMHVSSLASPNSRWGFRVAIDYVPPPPSLGVTTDRLGFSSVNDVMRVDLQMHLSGGVVTLKDVPYTFVKRRR